MCGQPNPEGIERKRLQAEAARQQQAFRTQQEATRKEAETAELRRMLGEAHRANMALQQQVDERNDEERRRQENELFVQEMEGIQLENDDDEN